MFWIDTGGLWDGVLAGIVPPGDDPAPPEPDAPEPEPEAAPGLSIRLATPARLSNAEAVPLGKVRSTMEEPLAWGKGGGGGGWAVVVVREAALELREAKA